MARIGQYKALGTKLGGYKTTLSKIQSKEYAKSHADWKAAEDISLYNQIGGTVANVIGIVQEQRLAREQEDMYAREFGIGGDKFAERVTKEGLKDNPFLKAQQGMTEEQINEQFWADENMSDRVIGLPETVDTQSSLFEGKPGETSPIPSFQEQDYDTTGGRGGSTAYRKLSPQAPTSLNMPTQPIESEYHKKLENVLDFRQDETSILDPRGGPSQKKSIHQLEIEASKKGITEQEALKREGVDQEYVGTIEKERDEDTRMGHVVRQRQKEIFSTLLRPERPDASTVYEQPSPITDDMAFDALSETSLGDFDISNIGKNKFYGKLSSTQKQNLQIAGKVGGSFAQKVMMRESSGGINTGDTSRTGSMFQFRKGGVYIGKDKIPDEVIGNPELEAQYFMDYNKQITQNFEKNNIYKIAETYGLSPEATNYGAHQQGGAGIQDIIKAADSGNLKGGNTRIEKMLNNVTEEQLERLNSKYRKASGLNHQALKNSGEIKSFIKDWLKMQQESWDDMEGDFY